MTEEIHVRLSDSDAETVRQFIKRGIFKTQSEVVRYGIKRLAQSETFDSRIAPTLTETQRLLFDLPVRTTPDRAALAPAELGAAKPVIEAKPFVHLPDVQAMLDLLRHYVLANREMIDAEAKQLLRKEEVLNALVSAQFKALASAQLEPEPAPKNQATRLKPS